jgi:VWFA-related protein
MWMADFARGGILLLGAAVCATGAVQDPQKPVLRSGVELLIVDAQVIDRDGQPIATLRPEDFEVELGGRKRRVASVELVRFETATSAPAMAAVPISNDGALPAMKPAARRQFILAVDEHSFRMASARAAMHAAARFVNRLEKTDLVGLYAYPTGTAQTDLTTDHAAVLKAIEKVSGLLEPPLSQYKLSKSEITDISSGDREVLNQVAIRECGPPGVQCRRPIQMEATSLAGYLEMQIAQSLNGLRNLIEGLEKVDGRKTLVLISGGLFASDRASGRVNTGSDIRAVGREAARANTTLYALHMDTNFIDSFTQRGGPPSTLFRDTAALAAGLEQVAGAAGGAVIRVQGGTGDYAFDRVLRENSAYYLLGVELEPADRNGESQVIRVRVRQRGATIRSRSIVVVPRSQ